MTSCRSAEAKVPPRLRELTDAWDALIHNCKQKKSRLQEAYEVHTPTQSVAAKH